MQMSREALVRAYRQMKVIRAFEERLHDEIMTGEIAGFTHLYAGQEAVAVGVCEHLDNEDKIVSTHRGHGHCIAKGCDVGGMMKEIWGSKEGLCKGKGGSMHIFDITLGILGANGILGASQPIAVGAAFSARLRGRDDVVATFFGEGASAQGAIHEAMNLAAVWKAPVVFVAEINGFAELTPYEVHVPIASLADRGAAYGIPAVTVDALDVFAVAEAARECVARARAGEGPSLLELRTLRWRGHYEGDPQRYRDPEELERRAAVDPIDHLVLRLRESGVSEDELTAAVDAVDAELEAALEEARSGPLPEGAAALEDVYTTTGSARA